MLSDEQIAKITRMADKSAGFLCGEIRRFNPDDPEGRNGGLICDFSKPVSPATMEVLRILARANEK